jgi:fumarate hydratase subunit alpha
VREITASQIKDTIKTLFININYEIGDNVLSSLKCALDREVSPVGKAILSQIIENDIIAKNERVAMCQDTGMAVVFAEVGQDVHITGGNFVDAINQGVREAYSEGCLRKSIVADPLFDRKNTGDNTPAVIYTDIVPGDKIKLTVTCKGFGSENMSRIKMMTPADGVDGVLDFIVNTVVEAGPNPCPPTIVGVCIGGTMDKAAQIAKLATIRPVGSHNSDPRYAQLEAEALRRINDSGVGPGGLGGRVTCLAVNIESYPTHIAGMPVAVNVCCHAARHGEAVI